MSCQERQRFAQRKGRGRETAGNVYICPETEPRLRHPRLPLSLIKHFLVFLYKVESKSTPPNTPSLGWLNKWGCLGAQIGEDRSHSSSFWRFLRFWGHWELMLPALREMSLSLSVSSGRYVANSSLLPWSLRRFLLGAGGGREWPPWGVPGRPCPLPFGPPLLGHSSQNAFLEL